MADPNRFDPFNDRLCRNVRNALSASLTEALEKNDLQPVRKVAGFFMDPPPPVVVRAYIDRRLAAYQAVLDSHRRYCRRHPMDVAMFIWDQGLFFETHEYLEPFWMTAHGDERALFQAMIRAAGTYVHLEQGNQNAAARIAAKAIPVLAAHRDRLAAHTDPDRLLDKLRRLDPVPPMLSMP